MRIQACVKLSNGNLLSTPEFQTANQLADHMRGLDAIEVQLSVTLDRPSQGVALARELPVIAETLRRNELG